MAVIMWLFDLFKPSSAAWIMAALNRIERRQIMDNLQLTEALTSVASGLSDLSAELVKSFDEITVKLGELQAGGTTPEQDAILATITDRLTSAKALGQKLDDLVPDPVVINTPPTV